jgi:hypothetical protein
MRTSIAHLIRSFSEKLSWTPEKDPIYKRLKANQLDQMLLNFISNMTSGWKLQNNKEMVEYFGELKEHVKEKRQQPALMLYETKMIPIIKEKQLKPPDPK